MLNMNDEINNVYNTLSSDEKEGLLKHFIKQEAVKKEKEISKYKDPRKFNTSRFAIALTDRLVKKLYASQIEDQVEERELVAAKSNTKKSKA